jgi:hypothetical protein
MIIHGIAVALVLMWPQGFQTFYLATMSEPI